jgi:TonB family protein
MHINEGGNVVSIRTLKCGFVTALLLLVMVGSTKARGQDEIGRKVKSKVAPAYPDLARRMNIVGVVKVMVTVAPNGAVKDAKVIGGHPVLANAALDAVKKWRFEVGPQDATGIVEFRFDPAQ